MNDKNKVTVREQDLWCVGTECDTKGLSDSNFSRQICS